MVQELLRAKRDLELDKRLKKYAKYEIILIDDFGYVKQEREKMEVRRWKSCLPCWLIAMSEAAY